jgi:multiple sugar transport system substrate-binding protein
MRHTRRIIAAAVAMVTAATLTACGSSGSNSSGSSSGDAGSDSKAITWWATNQAASLDEDAAILKPELEKFKAESGVDVTVEVVPWKDLYARITSAVTSGKGPDVVSIGNTWASSLQSTGAFTEFDEAAITDLGGEDRFLKSSFATTGAEGQPPTSIPILAQAYGLFYNKAMFKEAGLEPPTTWEEMTAAAKALTKADGSVWGISFPGAAYTSAVHQAFILGRQHGADPFDADGKPTFATEQQVAGIKQYTDLWQDGLINPSDVQLTNVTESSQAFAAGKAAMVLGQTGQMSTIQNAGMTTDQFGVVPIPTPSPLPEGGADITSFAAGTNVSIFTDSPNQDSSKALVKFLTSDAEQLAINKAYKTLPAVTTVPAAQVGDPAFFEVFEDVLANTSESLPRVPNEGEYETNVGNAVVDLVRQIVGGTAVDEATIMASLEAAQQKMSG